MNPKTKIFLIVALTVIIAQTFNAQVKTGRTIWSVPALDHEVFIEYKNQYALLQSTSINALYSIDNSGEYIFFTPTGLVIAHPEYIGAEEKPEPLAAHRDKEEGDESFSIEWHYTTINWNNTLASCNLIPSQPTTERFKYGQPDGGVIDCSAWKKLTYKNLYAGIDLEFVFHQEKGLKYNYLVHPGADISQIEMEFAGDGSLTMDNAGDLFFPSIKGQINDRAPSAWYAANGKTIDIKFEHEGNKVHFKTAPIQPGGEIIIDPWLTTPGFVNVDKAYDVERNNDNGNIYVFGGSPAHQIRKFDSDGVAQWTYTVNFDTFSGGYYGDIDLGPDGNLYYSDGCCTSNVYKLNESNQTIMWTSTGFFEPWRLEYNEVTDQLIAAGYGSGNAIAMDPATGLVEITGQIANNNGLEFEEIRAIAINDAGRLFSLHCSAYQLLDANSNRISCAETDLSNVWQQVSGYMLPEEGAHYAHTYDAGFCGDFQCFHGFNGVVASLDFAYTYDGNVMMKREMATGNLFGEVDVNGGITEECSGIVVDSCEFVYVGTAEGINQYDFDLNIVGTFPTDNGFDVYDLAIGGPAEMIVCGDGFVASMSMDCGVFASISGINPECNGECTGSATVEVFGGDEPYEIEWSTGSNQATISNLCPGIYTVSVTDGNGDIVDSQINIVEPTVVSANTSYVQPDCFGGCDASATATGSGGTPGYSYTWNTTPVQNSATASGLCIGNYVCTITDANGCSLNQAVTVDQPAQLQVAAVGHVCSDDLPNGYAAASVYGGTEPYSYLWGTVPVQTADTAWNLYTGEYSLIVTDANICIDSAIVNIPICYDTLFIPNVFTPNGDTNNPTFLIYNKGYGDFHLLIYDRWGVVLFESENPNLGWDGRINSGDIAADGVYYYIFTGKHYTGKRVEYSGYFHLVNRRD